MKFEYRLTLGYLIIGCLWIILSDKVLEIFFYNAETITRMQTYKGWFYVLITSIFLYFLLKHHLQKIRTAERKAKESDRLKTTFIQNISHEIRTPMNGIIGFTELLKQNELNESQKSEYLMLVSESSSQLLKIINEMLDISLIETGNKTVNLRKISLNDLCDEIYSSYKAIIKREISFSVRKGLSDTDARIISDDVKLKQILGNLLNNANKFTESGYINFGYDLRGGELEFFVEDSGFGIEKDQHEKIFERFSKKEYEGNRIHEGLGLGLSICKGMVELLDGRIWVVSESDKGSAFFFTLPYKKVDPDPQERSRTLKDYKDITSLKILVAEDDHATNKYFTELFKGRGVELITVTNGEDAVRKCEENNEFDLVLMDLKMPVMDGYTATSLIRKLQPGLPIIAQTAYALADEKDAAIQAGCTDYITKPFKKDQLFEVIARHVPGRAGKI